jgi:hypothetical protein
VHDQDDVLTAIGSAIRLMVEHSEATETALLRLLEFIGKVDRER